MFFMKKKNSPHRIFFHSKICIIFLSILHDDMLRRILALIPTWWTSTKQVARYCWIKAVLRKTKTETLFPKWDKTTSSGIWFIYIWQLLSTIPFLGLHIQQQLCLENCKILYTVWTVKLVNFFCDVGVSLDIIIHWRWIIGLSSGVNLLRNYTLNYKFRQKQTERAFGEMFFSIYA